MTAGGKRKADEALKPAAGSKLAPYAAAAPKPEKKQVGLLAFFSKKAAA